MYGDGLHLKYEFICNTCTNMWEYKLAIIWINSPFLHGYRYYRPNCFYCKSPCDGLIMTLNHDSKHFLIVFSEVSL